MRYFFEGVGVVVIALIGLAFLRTENATNKPQEAVFYVSGFKCIQNGISIGVSGIIQNKAANNLSVWAKASFFNSANQVVFEEEFSILDNPININQSVMLKKEFFGVYFYEKCSIQIKNENGAFNTRFI
jgi:hypothetical protein